MIESSTEIMAMMFKWEGKEALLPPIIPSSKTPFLLNINVLGCCFQRSKCMNRKKVFSVTILKQSISIWKSE